MTQKRVSLKNIIVLFLVLSGMFIGMFYLFLYLKYNYKPNKIYFTNALTKLIYEKHENQK